MHFGRQLAFAESQIEAAIERSESELECFCWLGLKAFEHAVAVLFICKRDDPRQFLSNYSYWVSCRSRFKKHVDTVKIANNDPWSIWPESHVSFGQYHQTGSSALAVAAKFSEGFYAETELARLRAYPNANVERMEASELVGWPVELRKVLQSDRPELAEWDAWAIHQERDRIIYLIKQEFEAARVAAEDLGRLCLPVGSTGEPINRDHLQGYELVDVSERLLDGFLRRWERMPGDCDLQKTVKGYESYRALPGFESELDGLLPCLWRVKDLAASCGADVADLRKCIEALRRNDVSGARSLRYGALADLQRMREAVSAKKSAEGGSAAGGGEPQAESDPKFSDDGLSPDGRTLRWGGCNYPLKPGAVGVLRLLVEAFLEGRFPYLHEAYLQENGSTETAMRHLVRDNGLGDVVIRELMPNGKRANKWGLIEPQKLADTKKKTTPR